MSQAGVARELRIGRDTVRALQNRPLVQETIEAVRLALREHTLARIQPIQAGAFDWLTEAVAQRDARAFDAVTRGVYALEKTAASASGEAKRIETKNEHAVATVDLTELADLLRSLGE